ncbi:hypothetical protein AZA_90463 [Nitrospirillum viridazoti Y2]|nr:hypothetical protein AZA_90463 [Nitrospirillum amazonense Y2]
MHQTHHGECRQRGYAYTGFALRDFGSDGDALDFRSGLDPQDGHTAGHAVDRGLRPHPLCRGGDDHAEPPGGPVGRRAGPAPADGDAAGQRHERGHDRREEPAAGAQRRGPRRLRQAAARLLRPGRGPRQPAPGPGGHHRRPPIDRGYGKGGEAPGRGVGHRGAHGPAPGTGPSLRLLGQGRSHRPQGRRRRHRPAGQDDGWRACVRQGGGGGTGPPCRHAAGGGKRHRPGCCRHRAVADRAAPGGASAGAHGAYHGTPGRRRPGHRRGGHRPQGRGGLAGPFVGGVQAERPAGGDAGPGTGGGPGTAHAPHPGGGAADHGLRPRRRAGQCLDLRRPAARCRRHHEQHGQRDAGAGDRVVRRGGADLGQCADRGGGHGGDDQFHRRDRPAGGALVPGGIARRG